MTKPTTGSKWGGLQSHQTIDSPALLLTAAGCVVFANPHYFPACIFLFALLLVVLTADALFRRCARVPADEAAWHELIRRYQQEVDAAIYHVLGFPPHGRHAHLYKDVLQRFRLRLLENNRRALRSFRGKTDAEARAYLCRIAVSIALAVLRKERPHVSLDAKEADPRRRNDTLADPSIPDEPYLLLRQTVDACLQKVLHGHNKERNILIFQLAVYDGLDPQQIADMPGLKAVSAHAVEQQITRIRHKLQRRLKKIKFS